MNIYQEEPWKTHRPLLKFFMKEFPIKRVVEHGVGIFSTELLYNKDIDYNGYDENPEFLSHVQKLYNIPEDRMHILETAKDVIFTTHYKDIPQEEKDKLDRIYTELDSKYAPATGLSLLFVDGFTCSRTVAINKLYSKFDVVLYHDAEPPAIAWYEYKFNNDLLDRYHHVKLTGRISWTGMFIKKEMYVDFNKLTPYVQEYCKENGVAPTLMNVVEVK